MPPAETAPNDMDFDLGTLFSSLGRNWQKIALVALVVTGLALLFAWMATPLYRAQTRILIETHESVLTRPGANGSPSGNPDLDHEGLTSQVQVISSTDILKQVARKLDLGGKPEFDAAARLGLFDRLLIAAGLENDPRRIPPEERVLQAMREKLDVYRIENSRVIVIAFSSRDPKLAAAIPNAIAEEYIAVQKDAKPGSDSDATGRLQPHASSRGGHDYLPVDARIFSRAAVPAEAYFPKRIPIVGAAFLVSLLVMAVITLLRELFSGRAKRPAANAGIEPVHQVVMPAARPIPGAGAVTQKKEDGEMEKADGELSIRDAAARLVESGSSRAIFLSPEGDAGAATSILVAREIADAGIRVLLLDLTETGAVSQATLESRTYAGITNLLSSEAQFTDVIHADLYSDCHVMPVGTADPERAMRAADRLPIILNSLTTAYDIVVVECGAADAESIHRLTSGDSMVLVSAIEPVDGDVVETTSGLEVGGYRDFLVVTPAGYEPSYPPQPGRSAA